jgi:hypothetical protein
VQEAQVASADIAHIWIAINGPAIEAFGVQAFLRSVEAMRICLRVHPNLAVLANQTQLVGFWVDYRYLSAHRHHTGVLNHQGVGLGVRVHWHDETPTECANVEMQLYGFDTHVRP